MGKIERKRGEGGFGRERQTNKERERKRGCHKYSKVEVT